MEVIVVEEEGAIGPEAGTAELVLGVLVAVGVEIEYAGA